MYDEKVPIYAGETVDDLILGDMRIIQPEKGYRFSLDAVLLAHFPEPPWQHVIELGAGSGVISLLMAYRDPQARFTSLEIQPAVAERAARSVALNGIEDRIEILNADIREAENLLPTGEAELVVSNPPFWRRGEGKVSTNPEEALARHEISLTLNELIQKGAYLLRPGGKMAIIHQSKRLDEALEIFRRYNVPARRIRTVHSFINQPARLVLIEAVKNRPGPLAVMPPLIIYTHPGLYSPEIKSIYADG
ncbi:S-adenosyl-L-methionine-dependent methyltransferase-like [Syntrophomonas zehnderi OL-4]|uniref:S-adenosyl-L-methionine-dependent methyltransferase-like n=1 Tax=Syntrophomonas zehnderi OL-4 TaxID=690567 RepID=A0A0E4C9I0_9FIRM|nr:tRNA1(Val) (adenine(37)-N6)-methyltransferase [Syntrophomonas zehnderi]CFY01240.1 S-adenosyl-L-methionine-dependent methyltransferase-like [Syntrophomonas zehnderi OL-4]